MNFKVGDRVIFYPHPSDDEAKYAAIKGYLIKGKKYPLVTLWGLYKEGTKSIWFISSLSLRKVTIARNLPSWW
jgi:hypothetical protein